MKNVLIDLTSIFLNFNRIRQFLSKTTWAAPKLNYRKLNITLKLLFKVHYFWPKKRDVNNLPTPFFLKRSWAVVNKVIQTLYFAARNNIISISSENKITCIQKDTNCGSRISLRKELINNPNADDFSPWNFIFFNSAPFNSWGPEPKQTYFSSSELENAYKNTHRNN